MVRRSLLVVLLSLVGAVLWIVAIEGGLF